MKIDFFKTKKSFHKKSSLPDPNIYWRLTILLFTILMIASSLFGYYTFMQIRQEAEYSIENIKRRAPVEHERIEKVLEYFFLREKKSFEIINTPSVVVDPSL